MERLTVEILDKVLNAVETVDKCCGGFDDSFELAKYEFLKKLKEYMVLEEQGRLLKLPCTVGDAVYTLNALPSGKIVIGETTADAFMCALGMLEDRFGKTIFLTRQEAETALKELEDKEI